MLLPKLDKSYLLHISFCLYCLAVWHNGPVKYILLGKLQQESSIPSTKREYCDILGCSTSQRNISKGQHNLLQQTGAILAFTKENVIIINECCIIQD